MVRIFFIRHAEREDHINIKWQDKSHRPHDSPLSAGGRVQAEHCAKHIEDRMAVSGKKLKVLLICSPLIRCVSTASIILQTLQMEKEVSIKIEEGFAEGNIYIKGRMMGTHRESNSTNMLTGKPRQMVSPVFLGPGDLVNNAHPAVIDFSHDNMYKVEYNEHCIEILGGKAGKGILHYEERIKVFLPQFLEWVKAQEKEFETEEVELIVLCVTHGAVGRGFTEMITGEKFEKRYGYCTTAETSKTKDENFVLENIWDVDIGNSGVGRNI